jgi:hypothetical protein
MLTDMAGILLSLPAAAGGGGGSGGMTPPANIPIAGRWYHMHNGLEPGAQVSLAANLLHVVPVVFPSDVTLDRISIDCSVTNSANARLGLYENASSGLARPGTLLVDSGSFALSVTTGANDQTISEALTGGTLYWAVLNLDAAATVQTYSGADTGFSFGFTAGDGAHNTRLTPAPLRSPQVPTRCRAFRSVSQADRV